MINKAHTSRRGARGFTLVEALLAAAVLSFAVLALTQAVLAGQMQTYDAMHVNRAVALAEAMVEEVLAQPYEDPSGGGAIGPEADEPDRQAFDNIDDYNGHVEAAGAVADVAGNLYPEGYQAFGRSVSVVADSMNVAALGGAQDGLRVTVVVSEPGGRVWTIERFVPEPSE